MIDTFCKAFEKWDANTQFFFLGIAGICGMVLIILTALWALALWRTLAEYFVCLFQGWPLGWTEMKAAQNKAEEGNQHCPHPGNLTHKCLRVGNCRTALECEGTVGDIGYDEIPDDSSAKPQLRVIHPPERALKNPCQHALNFGNECLGSSPCQTLEQCNKVLESWRKSE